MSERMPSQTPDHVVMSVVNDAELRLVSGIPEVYSTVSTATGKKVLVAGVPSDPGDFLLVPTEGLQLVLQEP